MDFQATLQHLYPEHSFDSKYSGIELDSRKVQVANIFVALQGNSLDGWSFVEGAIQAGATLIITNSSNWHKRADVEVIYDSELTENLGMLAGSYYGWPSKKLGVFGITGTNGKTSISLFTAQLMSLMGYPCGYIGTNGFGLLDQVEPLGNTTPDIVVLNKILADMVAKGAEFCAIEVSSHGLEQGRLSGIEFASTCFTNLSRDHLDYHGTMEAYAKAKSKLFLQFTSKTALINIDDKFGSELIRTMANKPGTYSYSTKNSTADISGRNINYLSDGISFELDTPWGTTQIKVPLFGEFNVSNLIASIGMMLSLGIEFGAVVKPLNQLNAVSGRMEFINNNLGRSIVVDYAHTPDALEKALVAIRAHCNGRLWVIFGCGGDRDRGKRPLMASVAEKSADVIIVTDDNPRTENSRIIMEDISKGFATESKVTYEADRKKAISFALSNSEEGDAILIAGKGHEDYQVVGTQVLPFSDQRVVLQYMEDLK